MADRVAAIIVTFYPDVVLLRRLISTLVADGVSIVVVDNGGGADALLGFEHNNLLRLAELGNNRGIGAAINVGIEEARKQGITKVVTFDQDSQPASGMVRALVDEFDRQVGRGVKIAAVGPRFIDRRQNPPLEHPFMRLAIFGSGHHFCASNDELIAVDTLITSGCLTSLEVLADVGEMDEGFFVDYTDIEWAFRAKSKGYVLMGVCGACMTHELGDGLARSFFGINLFEYSPSRRYYYARNTISVACLAYVPIRWKLRLVAGLTLRLLTLRWAPRGKTRSFKEEGRMMLRGILHGLKGVQGPIEP